MNSSNRPRVLVARQDSMGDVLVCGPAIRAISAGADVTLLVGSQGRAAAGLLPGVSEVLEWESPWIAAPAPPVTDAHIEELLTQLRSRQFDAAVILTSFHQSPLPLALLLRLAGVPHITGVSTDYAGALLDVRLRPGEDLVEDQPEPLRALAIASAAGFELPEDDDGRLAITPPPDMSEKTGGAAYVVLHPGASVPARAWPAANCAAAVELLTQTGRRVIVTGSPAERELTALVAGDHGLDLGGELSLPELAGVLAGAEAVVVGNTGPAHLAAAVGTPIVSLFSPVVPPARWAPYGVPTVLLGDQEAPCRGTRARECPVPGHPCLANVGPADVVSACDLLITQRVKETTP